MFIEGLTIISSGKKEETNIKGKNKKFKGSKRFTNKQKKSKGSEIKEINEKIDTL